MSLTPPSSDRPQATVPASYAVEPPSLQASLHGVPAPAAPSRTAPSWVAWAALALSAASLLVATSVGIVYAADTLTDDGGEGLGLHYDAGMPVWGTVELSPTGAATERTLTDSVEEALREGIQDVDGGHEDVEDVYCEAIAAPRTNSVGVCSALVQDLDTTIVLVFTTNDGDYLATIY